MRKYDLGETEFKSNLVRAFSDPVNTSLQDLKEFMGYRATFNSRGMSAWDIRFNRIQTLEDEKSDIRTLISNRRFWEFAMSLKNRTLYIYTKESNLERVRKNFGKSKIHYFHAFLYKNIKFDDHYHVSGECVQGTLFNSGIEDYNEKRKFEAIKMLGENYTEIDQVIFVTLKEEKGKAVKVDANLFSSDFRLVYKEDWSAFINPAYEESKLNEQVSNSKSGTGNTNKTIPVLKPEIQKKIQDKKKLPNLKSTKKNHKKDS
ncbi:hypothetical protein CHI05_07520 [Bacillus sp. 7788]|uniref:DUF5986 family protein n=1 Tax=Bacillus sp. 7788 TaxID=2021692 RepID=UPI000BA5C45C|nr:DUF5986 family protein [Bacillus sp. 7788]PAC82351.1 hypothetical protein CHI05_07520 [Bacillus sp. 7788]